jgi:hypothetical protein
MNRFCIYLALLVLIPVHIQAYQNGRTIIWQQNFSDPIPGISTPFSQTIFFPAQIDSENLLPVFPVYYELIFAPDYYPDHEIQFDDMHFVALHDDELASIKGAGDVGKEIIPEQKWLITKGQRALQVSFVPLRTNPVTGTVEKLVSFSFNFVRKESVKSVSISPKQSYAANSVLSSGKWMMIKTTEDGIYRLTYDELVKMGIENPGNVRIYGNGNRMLPKMNSQARYDDLVENRIYMNRGSDGIFNQGDYILFYGQGRVSWNYNDERQIFEHERHLYSDGSYYFITSHPSGKPRIGLKGQPSGLPAGYTDQFDDYAVHEEDLVNLIKSGRDWFGESFKMVNTYNFSFRFPNLSTGRQVKFKWRAAARAPVATSFSARYNSTNVDRLDFSSVNMGSYVSDHASVNERTAGFFAANDNIGISVVYSQNTPSAEGWLDYLLLNVRRSLVMSGNQMHFRDIESVKPGQVTSFRLGNALNTTRIWDITDPLNIEELNASHEQSSLVFSDNTDRLNQYIAFNPANFHEPEVVGPVPNQNLRGIGSVDMVIVSHPLFMNQANQLANHRRSNDGLQVAVVSLQQIYNEFSSGKPDVTAIRDFMRMLYSRAASEAEMPDYLLLFGRGSYDNRPGDPSGTNYVPTYQSPNSLRPTLSFVSDDFFGLLDENEGEFNGLVDIGIGRLPVSTTEQAQTVVNKIINYNMAGKKGDWQNFIGFIGDDGDNNLHMRQADILAGFIESNYPVYNIDKIYLDAWPRVGTSLGQRYPEVNHAIAERIRKGALVLNYTGHGNDLRLADENIIDINDIVSWSNRDRLFVFMTATCEFSRFDNPERVSAGEMVLLNPNGGGIALFSTTRLVYASPNFLLNQKFYDFILERMHNGRYMRLGDVMRHTKIRSGPGINKRSFALLGDPSMKLAIPEHNTVITSINETPVTEIPDTLKALGRVTISGRVEDSPGNLMTSFDGMVYHTVYDKENKVVTLGNDAGSSPFEFKVRNNILYKGMASVKGGEFSFSFIVPKDIAYHYGNGKISSFASNGLTDAAGYMDNIIIGGSDPNPVIDTEGPEIELFMNDRNFITGGMTDQNPRLLAYLTDSSGINLSGTGIGHDITLVLNRDPSSIIVLNDYYVADTDSYQSGTIEYPFSGLGEGNYHLQLKAWDVVSNSSEATLEFTVSHSASLALNHVFNYPNPFTRFTAFHFEHNRPESALDVLIQIFTVSGKLVKTLETSVNTAGFKPDPVYWDGLDDYGDRIGRGVYIYRLRVRTADGEVAEKYEKLVILK